MIRDRLVFGVKNDRIREKLLSEGGTLTLARAIKISRAIEIVQETQAQMNLAGKPPCMKQEIEAVRRVKKAPEKPFVAIRLTQYNTDIKFKIDTGAEVNVLPTADFFNLKGASPRLTKTKDILTSYSGGQLKVVGTINLMLQYKKQRPQNHVFYVVETDKGPILSRQTSEKLNLIKFLMSISPEIPAAPQQRRIEVDILLEEFSDVFDGIGRLPGTCHIHLKEGAVPTVHPQKRVPFALQPKLKQELERLEALGVIEKTTKPTDRPKSLDQETPSSSSTFRRHRRKCEGARKFFKVDARSGYWSMVLDDESSELTTFNTVFGRYPWKRYPFGLVSAQDEYQKKMEEAFEGIDIGLIIDDIAGMGATDEEHDRKLAEVLLRAKEKGVKFNRDKCKFDATSIPYFGHILTEEGMEKELLAITFACKHFHQYLFGRKVYVTTDHKPLEAILSKAINRVPPRSQRMMLAIQPYDLTFHYRPGKEIPVADTLSRLHLPDVDKEAESEGELAIHTFFKQIPITEKRMEHIRQERKAQLKQKTAYDRGSRTATELNPNQKVWVKLSEDSKWEKATIEKKYDKAPRSYNLSLESGGTFRRNRRDIRPRYEFASPTTYDGQQIGAADTISPMGQSLRASTPDKQTSTKFVAECDKSSAPLQVQAPTRSTPTTRAVLPNPLPTLTDDSSLYSQPGSSPVTITNQQVEQDTTATGGSTQPLASTSQIRITTSGRVVKPVKRLYLSIDRPNQYCKRLKSKQK
ncbi:hypothetical protein QYM36_002485 [Artemia franciscana]|uniref:Peptidase A2 domain-containing protein n=1 Tax=Artemia franciscana TaxID=6661 RepID=A0AA88LEM3_ARTSF|nr:hypothetical protein QYM36_002485 [Artemia franciscana]